MLFDANTDFAGLLEGQDGVVHLLSTSTPATSNKDISRDVVDNVLPTIALLEACRVAGTKQVLFMSSGGTVYGPNVAVPTLETAPTDPISGYGIVKLAIEKYMHMYERDGGAKAIVLRVANPFGPLQDASKGQGVIAAFAKRIYDGLPLTIFGDGSVKRDFIFVDDVVAAVESALLYEGDERIFNIGSGVGRSVAEVVVALEEALGRKALVERQSPRAVDVPASVLSINRAKAELDWEPRTSWRDGVRQTVDWMIRSHAG